MILLNLLAIHLGTMKFYRLKGFCTALKVNHLKNIRKGVYSYMFLTTIKITLIYLAIIGIAFLIGKYCIDFNSVFYFITNRFPTWFILAIFFVSEILAGIIPPDIFVIWSSKFASSIPLLLVLGSLSYAAGMVCYYIGQQLLKGERIRLWFEKKLYKYTSLVHKWGGAFIIISALLPFTPYSPVVIAVSMFRYPFRLYLLYGLARVARYLLQGIFYLNILDIGNIPY